MAIVPADSFLSLLNVERKQALDRQKKREDLLEDTEHGAKILGLHQDLQAMADVLDERVESKLTTNEKAFFVAYKSFMFTVQKEFKELKQKADEEETKTRRDAKIQSLEKELDWFMNEALRLDELVKKYKKELEKWKGKAEALEDDREFLERQIKQAKRTNKSLRGAVEKAQTSAYAALVDESTQVATQERTEEDVVQQASYSGLSQELEEKYQTTVKRLKQQLQQEQKQASKLRGIAERQFNEPSELEAFFVDCVEQVKVGIGERRKASLASRGYPDKAQPPSLDDFTVTDRRKVVELLLSSEQVLQFLYDKLFPADSPGH